MSAGRNPPQRQKTHLLSWEVVKLWGMTPTTHLPTPSQTGFLKHIPLWLSLGHSQWHGCKSPYQGKYINTHNMITVLYYVGFSRLVRKGVEIMQWTIYLTISHTPSSSDCTSFCTPFSSHIRSWYYCPYWIYLTYSAFICLPLYLFFHSSPIVYSYCIAVHRPLKNKSRLQGSGSLSQMSMGNNMNGFLNDRI